MTATKQIPTLHVCSADQSELKEFLVDEPLLQICSRDEDESKGVIVNECYTQEDESEYFHKNINKQKDARNEVEYKESPITDEGPIYFTIFECGGNLLNRRDVTYE